MHLNAAWSVAVLLIAGCSPYVYKSKINAFEFGVTQLAEAYASGLEAVAAALADDSRQVEAVVTAIKAFIDKAKAVHHTFAET